MVRPKISASLMCADLLDVSRELRKMEENGIDYIHYDIMDGQFVNNIALGIDLFNRVRKASSLPMDVHFLTKDPTDYIRMLDIRKGDIITVHCESDADLKKMSDYIRGKGARFGLGLKTDTDIASLDGKYDLMDVLLVMMIPAGFPGVPMVDFAIDRLIEIKKKRDQKNPDIEIEADGNVSMDNIRELYDNGASIFVAGSSSIYRDDTSVDVDRKSVV